MSENPDGSSIADGANTQSVEPNQSKARDNYNIVTDTVAGLNVRKSDNKFQAICVLCSMVVFAGIGAILAVINSSWQLPWYGGAMVGGFAGMVFGLFSSGIYLMIYRAVRHMQGKHD